MDGNLRLQALIAKAKAKDIGSSRSKYQPIPWARPLVKEDALKAFLAEAVRRIEAHGFESTVGHRFAKDWADFETGTFFQYHYYARYKPTRWSRATRSISAKNSALHLPGILAGRFLQPCD